MHWLYLLLSVIAMAVAFRTTSTALMAVALLAAFGLMVAWILGLLAARVASATHGDAIILDPDELRRLREQAEARRLAASQGEPPRP